jgi:hypothetical protein
LEYLRISGGTDFIVGLLEECCSIATAAGHHRAGAALKRARDMLTAKGATYGLDAPRTRT